jgi:glycosidase
LRHYHNTCGKGLIAIPTGNHDINPRLSKGRTTDDLELVFLFLLTMPGVPFIWYGDEIGMRSFDNMVSKEGGFSRTGVRTPMQWSESINAGFSTAKPEELYLPIDPSPDRPTVLQQEQDTNSLLQRVRKLVAIRKSHPALQATADFEVLYAQPGKYPLIYKRASDHDIFIIAINPSSRPVEAEFPSQSSVKPNVIFGREGNYIIQDGFTKISLPGVSGAIYRVTKP